MYDLRSLRRASAPDMQLHIAAFDFKLGNVLLHQQFDQFFDFFLIHGIPNILGFERARLQPCRTSLLFVVIPRGLQPAGDLRFRSTNVAYGALTSIRSFVTGFSTSQPLPVTTTMSSIR